MKKNLFIYLFVFAALIALYLVVNSDKMIKGKDGQIEKMKNEVTTLQDSLQNANLKILEQNYFSLENNDDALAYYDHLNLADPARYVADKLLETNEREGNNPLLPYEGMEGYFKLNKIKVLNHKWILADFSDGKFWGEVLIKYELKDDLGVDFTLVDHLLYTRSN